MITSVPLVPPWDQGDKNLAYLLANALPDISFRVLTTSKSRENYAPHIRTIPIYKSRAPSLRQKASVYRWMLSLNQASAIYHLIYRPLRFSTFLARGLPEFKRHPTIHTVPATANNGQLDGSLFFSEHIIAISKHGERQLKELGLSSVRYIPPGIPVEDWSKLSAKGTALKARLGFSGCKVVLFPGHYGPGQGADLLLNAIPSILAEAPESKIVFACRIRSKYDREREKLAHKMLHEAGYTQSILFYNTFADMKTLIGASDLVVLPLQTMQDKLDIPTTLLEAMAAAKPIIISDIAPMNELVPTDGKLDERVGFTFPTGDAQALARQTVQLIRDDALRQRIGQNAQAFVLSDYDIQKVARQYLKLYREVSG